MHNLWHIVTVSACVPPVDDAGQDRLLPPQVLFVREMGALSRQATGKLNELITSDRPKVSTVLPY
jgi:hypothetical protein